MRNFIRHPSNIPIDFHVKEVSEYSADGNEYLKNVSFGGLSFSSKYNLNAGAVINIEIPLIKPVFQAMGRVLWCRNDKDRFEIGVEFLDKDDLFRARMVEQICHIEQYKQKVLQTEGRNLSGEQAAQEWIKKFAPRFPGPDSSVN